MTYRFAIAIGLVLCCAPLAHAETVAQKAKRDGTFNIATDDPAMKAAFAKAQSTLGTFLEALDGNVPGSKGYTVKIPVTDHGKTEYFWIIGIEHKGDKFTGTVNNRPETVQNVAFGQTMSFPKSQIRDWGYLLGGKLQGNFTTCVLLSHEDSAEAQELKNQIGLSCE